MARYRLELDPSNEDGDSPYFRTLEPGVDWEIHGDQLAQRKGKNKDGEEVPFLPITSRFYNPHGSTWILPRPRQWDSTWNRSPLLEARVADKSKWNWCANVNPTTNVRDWNPLDIPGTPGTEGGDFMSLTVPATPGTAPLAVNVAAIGAAVLDLDLPDGLQVVAATKRTIRGFKTPFVQARIYPEPEDCFLFGFGQVAILLSSGVCYVLEDTSNGGYSSWKLRRSFMLDQVGDTRTKFSNVTGGVSAGTGGAAILRDTGRLRGLAVLPVGFDDIAISGAANVSQVVQLRKTVGEGGVTRIGTQIKPGRWWFCGYPGQRLALQFQAMTYHTAEQGVPDDPTNLTAIMMDLGAGYAPGEDSAPIVYPHSALLTDPSDPDDLVTTNLAAGIRFASTKYLDVVECQLIDKFNDPFVPDGVKREAGLYLKLAPGDDVDEEAETDSFGNSGCFPPQIKLVQVKFEPALVERLRPTGFPRFLTDSDFAAFRVATSLRDPTAKTVKILLWESGVKNLEDWGIDRRSDFPIHLVESESGDFTDSIIRVVCWVNKGIEFVEHTFENDDPMNPNTKNPDKPIRAYEIEAGGLIGRMKDSPWRYFGTVTDPLASGKLSIAAAAEAAFWQGNLDPTDTTFVYIEEDAPTVPVELRYLPATAERDPGTSGHRVDNPYGPDEGEDPASWLARILLDWRGWVLHERTGGQCRAEHDPRNDTSPTMVAQIYASTAAARAAMVNERQTWLGVSRQRRLKLVSNIVKVGGKGLDGNILPILLDGDNASVLDTTSPNFVGEFVRVAEKTPKFAVDRQAQGIIARQILRRAARRDVPRDWETMLAPWDIEPTGVECGQCVILEERGDWLVVAMDALLIAVPGGAATWRTTFTGELVS